MRQSLATRLSALYAVLLGVTIVLVIVASSIALVYELSTFTGDLMTGKHEEARELTDDYLSRGYTLQQAAPQIAQSLAGIGLRVAVFDLRGHFLAGDRSLRPPPLIGALPGPERVSGPPPEAALNPGMAFVMPFSGRAVYQATPPGPPLGLPTAPRTVGKLAYGQIAGSNVTYQREGERVLLVAPREPLTLARIQGGYVRFAPSPALLLTSLEPYWKVVATIAIVAMILSWFIGRFFARQALRPIDEVTSSLQALAAGDFTQRRFVMAGGDEVGTLTEAYNDAVAGVSKAMNERLQVEERMRQFVADAGHELRTPLTVLGGYIDVLRRGAIEEPKVARQILGTMALEKEHMRGLIDRLMRLARLDGEAPPRDEPIDVAELLRSQADAARRLDDRRQVDYSSDGVSTIRGDRGELGEALWNVVENALKYAPDAPIHLRAGRENGSTVITVRDEGPGMSEGERLHAFERFYRGDVRGEIVGSGLGLAIAKRAVERAGGTIALDSAPGQGTTVVIRLGDTK